VTSSGTSLSQAAAICGYALFAGVLLYLTCSLGLKRFHWYRATIAATRAWTGSWPAWASVGVPAGLVLAAVAATGVMAVHASGTSGKVGAEASARPPAISGGVGGLSSLPRPPTRPAVLQIRSPVPKEVTRPAKRKAASTRPASERKTTFIANTVQTASANTTPAVAETSKSRGPTPLQAPKSGSPPSPLKAP
jgi:hypothetical protein